MIALMPPDGPGRSYPLGRIKSVNAGSVMLALLAALLIMAVLASVIIPLVSSSGQQDVAAALASKAYRLAESGFRYAAGQYRRCGPDQAACNDTLEQLGGNYTLESDEGRFDLTVNAFFYEITSDANVTDTLITTRSPGTFPSGEIDLNHGLHLSIGGSLHDILGFTKSGADTDGNVTFTLNPLGSAVDAGTTAFPAVNSIASAQFLSNGGNLFYETNGGGMFPLNNGRVQVGYRILTYRYNDRDNNRFVDVRDEDDPAMTSFAVDAGTPIVLTLYARVHSTGVSGAGGFETRREVVYYDALPQTSASGTDTEFRDSFDSQSATAANWITDTGAHLVDTVDGGANPVLKVIEAPQGRSLITLRATTLRDLFNATRRSTGGYLSYDLQTKVGYYANTTFPPSKGYYPFAPIPAYVAAGPSFRLSPAGSSYNGYGLSFMRAGAGENPPLNIAPLQGKRLIVLWQQINGGQDYQWLAYKDISENVLLDTGFEDLDWDASQWLFDGLWRRATTRTHSGSYAFAYNIERPPPDPPDYDTGAANAGTLTYIGPGGNGVTLPADQRMSLNFSSWHQTENIRDFDVKRVQIRTRRSAVPLTWNLWEDLVPSLTPTYPGEVWNTVQASLAAYAGQTVQIRFLFQTIDELFNNFEGWYVDDVSIIRYAWPIMDATLVVRLKEAAVLQFSGGGDTPIRQGNRVYGRDSGTLGTVIVPPVLSGGDWASGDAQGVLLLNKVTSTTAFNANESLLVLDSNATALVTAFDNTVDRKVNVIKVYYADPDGFGTPDNTPLDADTQGYPRLEQNQLLQWPVDDGGNWTTESDYFRLIQWDGVNDANVTDLSVISSLEEPGAILRHHNTDLQSPGMDTTLNQPELGLHSYGDGAADVYFDDFGALIHIRQNATFPLQQ